MEVQIPLNFFQRMVVGLAPAIGGGLYGIGLSFELDPTFSETLMYLGTPTVLSTLTYAYKGKFANKSAKSDLESKVENKLLEELIKTDDDVAEYTAKKTLSGAVQGTIVGGLATTAATLAGYTMGRLLF